MDYRHLKHEVLAEEQRGLEILRHNCSVYQREKCQIVELLVEPIVKDIEDAVKNYYRYGKAQHIRSEGIIFKYFYYTKKLYGYGHSHPEVVMGINHSKIETCIHIDSEETVIVLPDNESFHDLARELNTRLQHKGIGVRAKKKADWDDKLGLYITANLGKL